MFVRIAIDQSISLHEAEDLHRLHVEVAGLDGRAIRSAVTRHGLGKVLEGGDIALRVTALRALAGNYDEHWAADFAAMIHHAQSAGWLIDEEHVRAHVNSVAAIPLPWKELEAEK